MYQLLVYYPADEGVRVTHSVNRGADVLTLIPRLLSEHLGCERVVVKFNSERLFSVDCAGNRLP